MSTPQPACAARDPVRADHSGDVLVPTPCWHSSVLPMELLQHVFSCLPTEDDLARCQRVSRMWREAFVDDSVFQSFAKTAYPAAALDSYALWTQSPARALISDRARARPWTQCGRSAKALPDTVTAVCARDQQTMLTAEVVPQQMPAQGRTGAAVAARGLPSASPVHIRIVSVHSGLPIASCALPTSLAAPCSALAAPALDIVAAGSETGMLYIGRVTGLWQGEPIAAVDDADDDDDDDDVADDAASRDSGAGTDDERHIVAAAAAAPMPDVEWTVLQPHQSVSQRSAPVSQPQPQSQKQSYAPSQPQPSQQQSQSQAEPQSRAAINALAPLDGPGLRLACGQDDGVVRVLDVATGCVHTSTTFSLSARPLPLAPPVAVYALLPRPGQPHELFLSGFSGSVALLDLRNPRVPALRLVAPPPVDRVYALAPLSGGQCVAGGCADGTVRVWDLRRGPAVQRSVSLGRGLWVESLCAGPGDSLVAADGAGVLEIVPLGQRGRTIAVGSMETVAPAFRASFPLGLGPLRSVVAGVGHAYWAACGAAGSALFTPPTPDALPEALAQKPITLAACAALRPLAPAAADGAADTARRDSAVDASAAGSTSPPKKWERARFWQQGGSGQTHRRAFMRIVSVGGGDARNRW